MKERNIIVVDGSYGEGGGQILRTGAALSLILKQNVKIINIRINRKPQGLKKQHLKILEFINEYLSVPISNVELGSQQIFIEGSKFKPPKSIEGKYNLETAASITLFLQGILPIILYYEIPSKLEIIGGSDVKHTPSSEYYKRVFFPLLKEFGYNMEFRILRKGYYPKGNGRIYFEFKDFSPREIKENWWHYKKALPYNHKMSISKNILKMMKRDLCKASYDFLRNKINVKEHECNKVDALSEGLDGIIYNKYLGIDYLGEKGKRLEEILKERIGYIKKCEHNKTRVDAFLGDQLLLPLSIYVNKTSKKVKFKLSEITSHLTTNIYIIKDIFRFSDINLKENKEEIEIKP